MACSESQIPPNKFRRLRVANARHEPSGAVVASTENQTIQLEEQNSLQGVSSPSERGSKGDSCSDESVEIGADSKAPIADVFTTCKFCGKKYKAGAEDKHEKRCRIRCQFCKKRHHRRTIGQHEAQCKYNKTTCKDCGKTVRTRSLERHAVACQRKLSKKKAAISCSLASDVKMPAPTEQTSNVAEKPSNIDMNVSTAVKQISVGKKEPSLEASSSIKKPVIDDRATPRKKTQASVQYGLPAPKADSDSAAQKAKSGACIQERTAPERNPCASEGCGDSGWQWNGQPDRWRGKDHRESPRQSNSWSRHERTHDDARHSDDQSWMQPCVADFELPLGDFWEDLLVAQRHHAWSREPSGSDVKRNIRREWPKSLAEYPSGHQPANPPGCCIASCNCMENWHLGKEFLAAKKKRICESHSRVIEAEKAVENFAAHTKYVVRRGTVSKKHHFEAKVATALTLQVRIAESAGLRFAEAVWETMRESAKSIPLQALRQKWMGCGSVLRALATAFHEPGHSPHRFDVQQGPPWLLLDPISGSLLDTADPVDASEAAIAHAEIYLVDVMGKARKSMELGIDVQGDPESYGDRLRGLLNKLALLYSKLWPPASARGTEAPMAEAVVSRLDELFDILDMQQAFPKWIFGMADIAAIAFGGSIQCGPNSKKASLPSEPRARSLISSGQASRTSDVDVNQKKVKLHSASRQATKKAVPAPSECPWRDAGLLAGRNAGFLHAYGIVVPPDDPVLTDLDLVSIYDEL